jgi:hypothetical protein
MLFFSLLHNSWNLQEQEAILLHGEGSETPYMTVLLFFRGSDFVSFVKVILRRGLEILWNDMNDFAKTVATVTGSVETLEKIEMEQRHDL